MLNRRILRIKAFKALYTFAENPSLTLQELENEFNKSCIETRNLYLYMLSLVPAITEEAKSRTGKHFPKFEQNSIAPILSEDIDFQKMLKKLKLPAWQSFDVLMHKLYDSIISKEYFSRYIAQSEPSVKDDAALFIKIFEEELVDNAELEEILEDLSIYWNNDLAYALTYCCKTMEDLARRPRWELPALYLSDMAENKGTSDKDFIIRVLRTAYLHFAQYTDLIAECSEKWDKERLFVTDQVLVICGLAEAASCPDIPVRVTINEYVEISKFFGTPKSRQFVNGVLDKIIKDMINNNEITKNL